MKNTQSFYDDLASHYHLIFEDWDASVWQQAEALDRLIRLSVQKPHPSILDCACGIGTQAIGLAAKGYEVLGTDLSPTAVERARKEAERWGVNAKFSVADMRQLEGVSSSQFDVVLCGDNSIAHLLTAEDLLQAFRSMHERVAVDGVLVVSTRSYDDLAARRPSGTPAKFIGSAPNRRVVFQAWEWDAAEPCYEMTLFILQESADGWSTFYSMSTTRSRVWQRSELTVLLNDAGFSNIQWHIPEETDFHQPVITARKKS